MERRGGSQRARFCGFTPDTTEDPDDGCDAHWLQPLPHGTLHPFGFCRKGTLASPELGKPKNASVPLPNLAFRSWPSEKGLTS